MAISQLMPTGLPGRTYGVFGAVVTEYDETGFGEIELDGSGLDLLVAFIEDIDILIGHESIMVETTTEEMTVTIGDESIVLRTAV